MVGMDNRFVHTVKGSHRPRTSKFTLEQNLATFLPGILLGALALFLATLPSSLRGTVVTLALTLPLPVAWVTIAACWNLYRKIEFNARFYQHLPTWGRRNRAIWRGAVLPSEQAKWVERLDDRVTSVVALHRKGLHQSGEVVSSALQELRTQRNIVVRSLAAISRDEQRGLDTPERTTQRLAQVQDAIGDLYGLAAATISHMEASTSARELSISEQTLQAGRESTQSLARSLKDDAQAIREVTQSYQSH